MITLHPVKIEAYEAGDGCFVVEAFDEGCATVTISALQTPQLWPVTAKAIQEALDMMGLSYDEVKHD